MFLVAGLFTLGISLAAPCGVFIAGRLARRKGETPTPAMSWFTAAVASSMLCLCAIRGRAVPIAVSR
jgi:MFS family permease